MSIYKLLRLRNAVYALIIMLVSICALGSFSPASARAAESINVANNDVVVGSAFNVRNMLPGDSITKEYVLNISHKKAITIHYRSDIRTEYKILAEVLRVKVDLVDEGITLYNGLMAKMPMSLKYRLPAGEDSLRYTITTYLDKTVGVPSNIDPDGKRYMNQKLVADFRWWYLEETKSDSPTSPVAKPATGTTRYSKKTTSGTKSDAVAEEEPTNSSPVAVKLIAEKILNGERPTGNNFTFLLSDSHHNTIQTKNNNREKIEFETLTFSNPGVYTFYLSEQNDGKKHITYDNSTYTISIRVTEESGELSAFSSYSKDGTDYFGTPRFVNSSTSPQGQDYTKCGICLALLLGLLLVFIILRRRKEGSRHE